MKCSTQWFGDPGIEAAQKVFKKIKAKG